MISCSIQTVSIDSGSEAPRKVVFQVPTGTAPATTPDDKRTGLWPGRLFGLAKRPAKPFQARLCGPQFGLDLPPFGRVIAP